MWSDHSKSKRLCHCYLSISKSINSWIWWILIKFCEFTFVKGLKRSFIIVVGDFNARSKSWWPDDITSPEVTDIDSLTAIYGLHQLLSDPVHLLPNSLFCVDLIFTDQPNLAVDWGVPPSLHPKCHHQIIYCKFNLMIEYPRPYERLVWDYNHVNQNAIAKALDQID